MKNYSNYSKYNTFISASNTFPKIQLTDAEKQQINEIAGTCLSNEEHEKMTGGILRHGMARFFNARLADQVQQVIGLRELRSVAGFSPMGNWTEYQEPYEGVVDPSYTVEVLLRTTGAANRRFQSQ
uniref:DUF4065 domain-containing protein n=1 Tax=Caenorhabditis tropicalis TaxID=1561998 RepID=A0A1I7UEB0_9PELO